jgi:hypothetical protein
MGSPPIEVTSEHVSALGSKEFIMDTIQEQGIPLSSSITLELKLSGLLHGLSAYAEQTVCPPEQQADIWLTIAARVWTEPNISTLSAHVSALGSKDVM